MNLSFFTARKIATNKAASFSKFIIKLATLATALSVAIMILAVGIVQGFQKSIEQKLLVFWGDFQIAAAHPTGMIGMESIAQNQNLEQEVSAIKGVKNIEAFALKAGILKGNGPVTGIKLKGVRPDFPFKSTSSISYEGEKIKFVNDSTYSTDIILSKAIIDRLNLSTGDDLIAFFIDEGSSGVRKRMLHLVGSFHTGVGEVDNTFALCDIKLIQQLNNWNENQISGYQVQLEDYRTADSTAEFVYENFVEPPAITETIKNIYPGIFSWINVQDVNAKVLLIIMAIVAIINMATALLIFILERTQMIGMLKAMGMHNWGIQKIFLVHAAMISLKGILWGNFIAIVLGFLQMKFKFITLDESVYYMKYAPIHWDWRWVVLIDLGALLLTFLMMILPSLIIRKINIVKAIKFT